MNEPKVGPKVETKVEPKVEEKKEEKKEELPAELTQEQKSINAGAYLSELLDIEFGKCYKFAMKNPLLTKEELLQAYFENPRQL